MGEDGFFVRQYADGGVVYCMALDSYVEIESFDAASGVYRVRIKNKEVEERVEELEEETKPVYTGTIVHGYHLEFLDEMQVDTLMLEALPDDMRIEILSQFDMDYAIWMSQKEAEISMSSSVQQKEQEKRQLMEQANELIEIG